MLGVAFMAGTLVLTDTIKQSYDDVAGHVYEDTDAVVRSARTSEADGTATHRRHHRRIGARPPSVPVNGVAGRRTASSSVSPWSSATTARCSTPTRTAPSRSAIGVAGRAGSSTRWSSSPGTHRAAPDEIVIDRASHDKGHFDVGEKVDVSARSARSSTALAGVATYGGADSAAGAQVVAFTPETAAEVLGTAGRYDGDPGRRRARRLAEASCRQPADAPIARTPTSR